MGNNLRDDPFTILDLNQHPFVDPSEFGSFSGAHETPPRTIEDRIKLLQAVARKPQIRPTESVDGDRFRNKKRDISQLTKALEMDVYANGNLFSCNICFGMAKDPILTCCGHLFCWGCFYHIPYVDSVSKECPVCQGEVIDSNITPVYGNGNENGSRAVELDCRMRIPPRPRAHRVESVGQESFGPVADALRRIRNRTTPIHRVVSAEATVEINLGVSSSSRRRLR